MTSKERLGIKTLKEIPMRKTRKHKGKKVESEDEFPQLDDETKKNHNFNPDIDKLLGTRMEEGTSILPELSKENIVEVLLSKDNKCKTRLGKPKISIDLNRTTSKEDQNEDMVETEDETGRHKSEECKIVIEYLKH
jgi:hypothetical protein